MKLSEEQKKVCNNIIEYYDNNPSNLLQILLKIQRQIPGRFINLDTAEYIASKMNIPLSNVSEVVTYFDALSIERELGIKAGQTTEDGLFTLELVPCFGACDIAPAVRVNDNVVGKLNEKKVKALIAKLREAK